MLDRGDVNLTFKRYLEAPVRLTLEDDYVTEDRRRGRGRRDVPLAISRPGATANAYAVSHVGFGLNPKARYEALAMYDQRDTNGTEIRAVAGNFLFSTGANEFAGRYTAGHFDLPVMRTTITVDGTVVVKEGVVQDRELRCHPEERSDVGCTPDSQAAAIRGSGSRMRASAGMTSEHRRPVQPEMPEQLDERLQPLAPIGLDIEPFVVEKARAVAQADAALAPCCARRSPARRSARCRARR